MHKSKDIMILTHIRLALVSLLLLSMASCRAPTLAVVEKALHDTLYVGHEKYDSIYIADQSLERYLPSAFHYDTVVQAFFKVDTLIRDKLKTEFRYKLLHDTTYIHRVDTIPRVITVTQTHYKSPPWLLYAGIAILFLWLIKRTNPLPHQL